MSTASRFCLALLLAILATVALARSEGIYNPSSNSVGDYQGIDSNAATGTVGPIVGALLLEDGTSIILLEDGTSNLCLEGGC